LGLHRPPSLPPPLYISLKNIYPVACFTAPCGHPSVPLRICWHSHLPHALHRTLCCSLLARPLTPPLLVLVVPSRALGRSLAKPRAPMRAACAGGDRALRPESDEPAPTPPPICCKCMCQVFQTFQRYIVGVSYGCCKSILGVAYIASVSETYCKRLFKIFHLFQSYVASIFIWIFHIFHTYVARVCSKCFSCFSCMLK
jgi:hypothetical protein